MFCIIICCCPQFFKADITNDVTRRTTNKKTQTLDHVNIPLFILIITRMDNVYLPPDRLWLGKWDKGALAIKFRMVLTAADFLNQ